jgi:Protein of unknown function (DUF4230)
MERPLCLSRAVLSFSQVSCMFLRLFSKTPAAVSPGRVIVHQRSAWPFATVAIVVLALVAIGVYYGISAATSTTRQVLQAPAQLLTGLAAAFRPETTATTEIRAAIGKISTAPKFVCLTADIDAEIRKSSATNWGYLYWGTTRVALRAHNNKIQYFIPVSQIQESNFSYDEATQVVTLTMPAPRLDTEVVDVQSDPRQIEVETSNGWAKFDHWSGEPLREEAKQDLRQAVLSVAGHELLQAKARAAAQEQLQKLLSPLAAALKPGIKLQIAFQP